MAKKLSDAELVDKVKQGWDSSWSYREGSWHKHWQDMYKLYNSERVLVGYNGISDTFIPISYSTIETMVAATSGDKPEIAYVPTKAEQKQETEVLNGLFSYYWDLDNWTNKFIQRDRNLYLYGSSVLFIYWDIDHPCLKNIPLRDFFIDPNATILTYQNAAYMGYRFLASKDALASEKVVDPDTEKLVPKYKNLNKIGENPTNGENTDKQEKDTQMGTTVTGAAAENQVEVICYWTKEEVVYVANRSVVIARYPNFYKERQQFLGYENPEGMYPFIVDSLSPDESLLYGKSALDAIAKPQELLNDLTNQNVDAVAWALDPVMELDPQYSAYIDKVKNVTGAVYPFKPNSLQVVQKPPIPSNAFNERTNIKNEIRETTGIDEVLSGIFKGDRTTATEVKAQTAAAGRRFGLIAKQLENGGYTTLARLVFQMVKMYVTTPTYFRVIGEKGVNWQEFDPEMFQGDYEPRVKLATTVETEKNQKMRNLKEMYTALLGSSYVRQDSLTRLVVQKAFDLEPDEVDELVMFEEEVMQKQMMMQQAGQKEDKEPTQLINYKDAPPDIKAQMEKDAGYEPSFTHEDQLGADYMEREAVQAKALSEMDEAFMPPQPEGDVGGQLV